MTKKPMITSLVRKFRETKNPYFLIGILALIVKQQRTLELIYSGYCRLLYRPSPVHPCKDQPGLSSILSDTRWGAIGLLSRHQLIERYGPRYQVGLLPDDFECTRRQGVCEADGCLVIGEYGEDSRLAYVTDKACILSDHYRHVRGVRHIHAVHRYEDPTQYLVTTGDGSKRLDLWFAGRAELKFVRALRKRLAGFTAVVRVRGEYYFGTDYSGRPNYIVTLAGTKYILPQKAYNQFVTDLYVYLDRYIVVMTTDLKVSGGKRTISVFDTIEKGFIHCDDCSVGGAPYRGASKLQGLPT
jgi:hypothetical protein